MKPLELLHLAALLHDIGKFRMRHTQPNQRHQEHSYEFVNEDFAEFFSPCGEIFKNAIRHHHPERYPGIRPIQLEHLIEKQVILADRLSASEREDEEREREHFGRSALVSTMSRLKGFSNEYRYRLNPLAIFGPFQIVHSLYTQDGSDRNNQLESELKLFDTVLKGMEPLEDDYLGGSGSRGYGQIGFKNLKLTFKSRTCYEKADVKPIAIVEDTDIQVLRQSNYTAQILAAISGE